jgi:TPP-dependent pyruvate/acetoin dehydrogenase alpha subunit/pyruvate/2-oxoglutarate/acetoin dehydrogenase E1 component
MPERAGGAAIPADGSKGAGVVVALCGADKSALSVGIVGDVWRRRVARIICKIWAEEDKRRVSTFKFFWSRVDYSLVIVAARVAHGSVDTPIRRASLDRLIVTDTAATIPAFKTLEQMLMIRHFEQALLALFQAGKLNGTTHTCIGQEAIPVAVMPLLRDDDFIFSNHRGHGHYLARFGDYAGLLAEIMGREGGVCGGVGGSQHLRRGRYFSTGVQGESLPVAAGAAWQLKREGAGGIAVAFIGDGTWGQGAVYEALNMAALWRLPLVVIVENNDIAQTTPRVEVMAGTIANRVRAFGAAYLHCAGSDVEALRAKVAPVLNAVRREGPPAVIEFQTQRLASHSKGDDTRDPSELAAMWAGDWCDEWRSADTIGFETIEQQVKVRIGALVSEVEGRALAENRTGNMSLAALAPAAGWSPHAKASGECVLDHLNRALHATMSSDELVVFLGEDVLDPYGGAFKVARGLSTAFPDRVLTTPISELAIAGFANGLALAGRHAIAEFMFGDFIFLATDQIMNFAAKSVTMYGMRLPHPVVFRCPVGGHRGYGPTHSQSVQKHFIGVPNLDLYELSPLHDMVAHLPQIFARGNPAILFESKTLYAQPKCVDGRVDELFAFDFLDAEQLTARAFIDAAPQVVIFCMGGMFPACVSAARQLFFEHEIEAQIVVPLRLYPFDAEPLATLLHLPLYVVEESTAGGTWGAEIAATLGDRARVRLINSADSIIPSARHLEKEVLVQPEGIVHRIVSDFHAADHRPDHQ